MTAPGPMTPTTTTTITGGLYAETFAPTGTPAGVVLITHGYAEHCARYREVANVICQAGWAALAYDCRGHGRSPGERGYIDRFETYLTDLAGAHSAARALVPEGAPLVLLGHSHGGLITLRALCGERPPACVHAIISSPYLALHMPVPGYKKLLARVASKVAPHLAQPNNIRDEDLTHDPVKQAEHHDDKLCFDVAIARWFTESDAAQRYVAAHAERIRVPTTWFVAGEDALADPAQSRRVADKMANCHYTELPGFRHEVFNEVDRAQVFQALQRTLRACASSS